MGQIWSKITQPRGQNEKLTFLGQNISLKGKPTKNSEFQGPSCKKWFLVLYSNKKLVFEFLLKGPDIGNFNSWIFRTP